MFDALLAPTPNIYASLTGREMKKNECAVTKVTVELVLSNV